MIETERLVIRYLTHGQLIKYIREDNSLETELNLNGKTRTISSEFKEALEKTILPNVADNGKNYLYFTLWAIILKEENKMVGDLGFISEPNADGEIEIGYGIFEAFRNRGFMTEAVSGMIKWAGNQPGVKSIFASKEKNNIASCSILNKNKFIKSGETNTLFNWRLKII